MNFIVYDKDILWYMIRIYYMVADKKPIFPKEDADDGGEDLAHVSDHRQGERDPHLGKGYIILTHIYFNSRIY